MYSSKSKLFYGMGDIFGGGAFLLISLLFLNYLTDVELISPALAGIIIMVGKFIDAITDPLMGYISDKTNSKFGRRRIYFLAGILPILMSFTFLWYSFNLSKSYLFIYYLLMYGFFSVAFTIVMIPYNSILPEMVKEYNERTSFITSRMSFSVFSAMLAGILPSIIIKNFDNVKTGYLVMGFSFALLYAIPWIFVFFGTWEPKDSNLNSSGNFLKELLFVFKNKLLRIHLSIFLTAQAAVDLLTALFIYYLSVCLNRQKEFSLILGTLLIMQLIFMPIHSKISRKYGKTSPIKIGLVIWALALISSLFLKADSNKAFIYIISAVCGIGTSAATFVPWSILPEISDVDELLTGKRREGIYSGIVTFVRKLANGLVIGLLGLLLQLIGYVAPSEAGQAISQSASTANGIKILFGVFPIIFILLTLYFQSKYTLNGNKHEIIMAEIKRIKETGTYDATSEVREICEEISGIKYDNLKNLKDDFKNISLKV